ncbi:MAG: non-hydrolyzing UDP-N-acetylglucosamine 2-epimerase [Sphingorhabdus sp.]
MKTRVLTVFGTRPEAIKMAPLCHALSANVDEFENIVCVTAQHRQMLDQVLDVFNIIPDIDLNIMKEKQDLFDVTVSVLSKMKEVILQTKPDLVLVHGDTTTAMASAMAAFYSNVPIGHVEAGLRTYDVLSPFPEEFNRQTVSSVSKWHFAPTETSKANLNREGVSSDHVFVTGNTVIDALFWVLNRIEADVELDGDLRRKLDRVCKFNWSQCRFIMVTGHRRENFGEGFLQICKAIKELAERYPNLHFVYPVHLNPNVRKPVLSLLQSSPNVHLIEPLDYEPFVFLLKHCWAVLTDSGGIQEEAPSLGKPVLVMREFTERPEAVEAGTVRLVGADYDKIVSRVSDLVENESLYVAMSKAHNPYGDGNACSRIIEAMRSF